jgi:hypothetical protein
LVRLGLVRLGKRYLLSFFQIQFNSAKLKDHMFKVDNGIVQIMSSTPISFDNIVRNELQCVNCALQSREIPIKEFPPSGFM